MRRLRYLATARRDLAEIYGYIESRSGSSATVARFIQRIRAQCRHIGDLPIVLGTPRPDLLPEIRTFPFEDYVIVLRYVGNRLEIASIFEGHRDIRAIFGKKGEAE